MKSEWQKDFRLKFQKKGHEMEDYFYLSLSDRQEALTQLSTIAQTIDGLESYTIEEYDPYLPSGKWVEIK